VQDDMTPFGMEKAVETPADTPSASADEVLFGTLWPLGPVVKIDPTVGRQLIRDQSKRLGELGYELDFRSQQWSLKEDAEAGQPMTLYTTDYLEYEPPREFRRLFGVSHAAWADSESCW
ncbi:DUF3275 family protein, partial [Pseudomonas stutzeri]|uniref:DUF3275 family protein n=1 Tax=Stutzerimonas stutzeri TaxID=316 RepID=UPI00210A0760